MKAKKEFVLLIIIIIALSLYLILRTTNKTHYQLPHIPEIVKKEITKIDIRSAENTIALKRKDNKWFISPKDYPAETAKVKNMLDAISEFALTDLVSEAKNYQPYDLTDDKKINVKAWAQDSLKLEFEIGRTAPSWNHTFVRLAGDTRVYYADGNFKDKFDMPADKIRDKIVLSFDQTEIEEIEIIKGKQSIVFAKKRTPLDTANQQGGEDKTAQPPAETEITWENSNGDEADESIINRMLSALSNLSCEKYIEDKEKNKFTEAIYIIKMKGDKKYILSVFEKADGDAKMFPATSSENGYAFLLSDSQGDKIMKDPDEVLKKEKKS